ncbi:DUF4149 domain-containing protein [Conchiformibius steedae]|uniref:DUF4149 domain-containing protein n=1 Tax=Conchiformibius steedae TaxID=153493 RepID=A0A3P2A1Q0_9NEIS|nr:DUF4149 domain-containing protein [Conchiformibius steedae]RRD89351.1 DUF4149 domain-containing protein [Conchiformibius steedae]
MKRLSALLIALWLGMQIGFLAASLVLFNQLLKEDAGRIAGILFHITNLMGLVTWAVAWLACRPSVPSWGDGRYQGRGRRRMMVLMLALLATAEFVINPVIHALKHGQSHVLSNLIGGGFGAWHGTSYILYLMISFLGLILAFLLLRLETR